MGMVESGYGDMANEGIGLILFGRIRNRIRVLLLLLLRGVLDWIEEVIRAVSSRAGGKL
jgi:hypothetical protein